MRWTIFVGLVLAFGGGCHEPGLTPCGDSLCPRDTECIAGVCVGVAEFAECEGRDGIACQRLGATGVCSMGACITAQCGDGLIETPEVCDDGNLVAGDGCGAFCRSDESCGNAIADTIVGEVCDDGNTTDGDGCSGDCRSLERCGNGIVDEGEECDTRMATEACGATCLEADCGNGVIDIIDDETGETEQCDDGDDDSAQARSHDGCSSACLREFFGWGALPVEASPSARQEHAMIYDPSRGVFIMYGGRGLTDTWEFDGREWVQASPPASPTVTSSPSLAYFNVLGKVVLVGLNGSNTETWTYDGTTWVKLAIVNPSGAAPYFGARVVEDKQRGVLVMFGGGDFPVTSDTWEFDGTTWTMPTLATSPPPRNRHGMTYDPIRQVVVMYGGNQTFFTALDDTWEYDGANWTPISVSESPPSRWSHTLVYASNVGKTLLSGGWLDDPMQSVRVTLYRLPKEYDGTSWASSIDTLPSLLNSAAAANDDGRPLMFGGMALNGTVDTTWRYWPISTTPDERCTGGIDEDGDGLFDCDDPDCAGATGC